MSNAVDAIQAIKDDTAAKLTALVNEADGLSAEEVGSQYGLIQGHGVWEALFELARRVDHAPDVAVDLVGKEIAKRLAGGI
ncbi:hypothetical protein IT072_13920 [Leifsonia sp. ZF2019]|uniref:hypothetical protein n=1 Tax=Leifsonia sp. ZF2019 TaxID=2781978 RepID=UPI001CBB76F5|nr:hypothetical protein [Leifsonia sp. ZF2019]UAJ78355.1 hypothetical protein IT072_13920 [Leifsonia sp. ZF2019]